MSEEPSEPNLPPLYKTQVESREANSTQTEKQACSQSLHHPLKQTPIPQDNMEPNTKQAVAPDTLTEEQQEPLSLVKNRKPMSRNTGGITQVQTESSDWKVCS